jgi:hypothetical protein
VRSDRDTEERTLRRFRTVTIARAARLCGVSVQVLRKWERLGAIPGIRRRPVVLSERTRWRSYDGADLELIRAYAEGQRAKYGARFGVKRPGRPGARARSGGPSAVGGGA